MKRNCIILIILHFCFTLNAQTIPDKEKELEILFSRFVENRDDTTKLQANDSIRNIIGSYVKSDSVFRHKFLNLRYLGQVISPDSMIKIVTWNMNLSDGRGKYFCFVIRKKGTGERIVYSLESQYRQAGIRTDTIISKKDWYGALYYDLKPYIVNGRRCWVILGLDFGNPEITRKIIDVLNFRDDDSLYFGLKWFEEESGMIYRKVFEYASSGMMSLRFTTDNSIVFDHLVPLSSMMAGDRRFYGPDYSYDAYILKDGAWRFSLNVDARNKE